MRKWIDIAEGKQWDDQIAHGYDLWKSLAQDHAYFDDDDEDFSPESYATDARNILEDIIGRKLYRGMKVTQYQLENHKHLGVYYSMNADHSRSFARGGDNYDDRFKEATEDAIGIVIEIEPVSPDQVDAPTTVAMNRFGGEEEVRLLENETVTISRICDESGRMIWQHLWGAQFQT